MRLEFRRRLIRLKLEIEKALLKDSSEIGLMPALFKVVSYLWTNYKVETKKHNKHFH